MNDDQKYFHPKPHIVFVCIFFISCSSTKWIKDEINECSILINNKYEESESIKYSGDCVQGKANGPGVVKWYNWGREMCTEYSSHVLGVRDGDCSITDYKSGNVVHYSTTYKNGKRDGKSVTKYLSGKIYKEYFADGEKNDTVEIVWPNGKKYIGEVDENKVGEPFLQGNGKIQFPNGDCYEGTFSDNQRHGIGEYVWKDGFRIKAKYENDKRDESIEEKSNEHIEQQTVYCVDALKVAKENPPRPKYPEIVRKMGEEAEITISVLWTKEGKWTDPEVVSVKYCSEGAEDVFVSEILRAIKNCSVSPLSEEGITYEMRVFYPFKFRLR